jgi:hypothetical protein
VLTLLVSAWVINIYEEDGDSPVKNSLHLFLKTRNLEHISDLCSFFITSQKGDELEEMEKKVKSGLFIEPTLSYSTEISARDDELESATHYDDGRMEEDGQE